MKVLYTPIGILFGVLGGLVGRTVFGQVWKRISDEDDPPGPRQSEYGWREVIAAAALQGAIFAVIKAAIDRGGARGFQRLTGVWPGD